ncbi:DUF6519 domain-containing protein [Lunatibacter salilacus]|uniref:DUF6519 domain-containing protein n=1 Tax=Lunatibacter salilacus TaxID=2483804 RepID=UPI00131AF45D|nr:DUF6519 domain-containing protein [Lunatibacter salilacus]
MKGDFSRITGIKAKRKHYSGLLKQQGRVQLDSDWNELISIIAHQRGIRTIDAIGECGAPIHNSGFEILHPGGGLLPEDLLIAAGRFYVGGLLCETTPGSKLPVRGFPSPSEISVDDTKIDGVSLAIDHWVQLLSDEQPEGIIARVTAIGAGTITLSQNVSSFASDNHPKLRLLLLYSQQPDYPGSGTYTPIAGQTDLFYLDVWERHVTVIEDPELREVALAGPDTDTRSKIMAQVKLLANVGNIGCGDQIDQWNSLAKAPNGRLTTRPVDVVAPANPCQLGESGGFLGLENRLYRVEIHDPSASGIPSFKWSRDNASYAYPIQDFFHDGGGVNYNKISLGQNGKDAILKIKELDWIEVSEDFADLSDDSRGTFAQVLKVEGNLLTLDTNVTLHRDRPLPKIRRWDTSNQRPDELTDIVTGASYQLEDGIEIEFSGTEFKTGDYWCFSARTLTGEIEILDKEAPMGVKHHYCRLGMVTGLVGGGVEIEDCRPEFPPLTELPPTRMGGGCCTVTVGEDEEFQDIQLAVDSLNGGPGTVCIKPGVYVIDQPITVTGRDITIKGCEGKPVIINKASSPENSIVFQVSGSWDIDIHDLWCISTSGDGGKVVDVVNCLFFTLHDCLLIGAGTKEPNGVVTFQGLTINTNLYDNLILGRIGIRYDSTAEQDLNLHMNARMAQNIAFVLENGIFQAENPVMVGVDCIENLLLGFNKGLLGKPFFPKSLFKVAIDSGLYAIEEVDVEDQEDDLSFDDVSTGNTVAVVNLESYLRVSAHELSSRIVKASSVGADAFGALDGLERSLGHIIKLVGTVVDVNITDNILLGQSGILTHAAIECSIDKNLILAKSEGIEMDLFNSASIDNNLMVSGQQGIVFLGKIGNGLTITNNRITSQQTGIATIGNREFHLMQNIQIDNNTIYAGEVGIHLSGPALILMDLTLMDNSITGGKRAGIAIMGNTPPEELRQLERQRRIQRIIQRNSITVVGSGIIVGMPQCEVLDNVVNTIGIENQHSDSSWGIQIMTRGCSIVNNTIHAYLDIQQGLLPNGGIFIIIHNDLMDKELHEIDIIRNTIIGGVKNGIEIASTINGMVIEGNEIANMTLNGIAVQRHVQSVNNLRIAGNHIHDCFTPLPGDHEPWWSHAAIVLSSTSKTQIIGNRILNNARVMTEGANVFGYGAFYAEQINEIQIVDNQFTDNWGIDQRRSNHAIIHVPIRFYPANSPNIPLNEDIQISNNIIKGSNTLALEIGNYTSVVFGNFSRFWGLDSKAVISQNHFETTLNGPIVQIHLSLSIFSNNFVSCAVSDSAVSLGYGGFVMANSNVVSDPITGAGINQQIINTLQF